jgi:transposase-like protein
MSGASRGIPFHCPYCGDEDLRPSEEGHGAWECHACLRAFSLKMLGMLARPGGTTQGVPLQGESPGGPATDRSATPEVSR